MHTGCVIVYVCVQQREKEREKQKEKQREKERARERKRECLYIYIKKRNSVYVR